MVYWQRDVAAENNNESSKSVSRNDENASLSVLRRSEDLKVERERVNIFGKLEEATGWPPSM